LSSVDADKAKIANLEAQLSLVSGNKANSNGQIRVVSTAIANQMTEAFKTCIYPDTQLVSNNEKGKEVMMRVFDLIKDQLKLDDTNAERDSFYLTYLKTFKTMLTAVRNNTQQELKKAAKWWLDQPGAGHDTLPSHELILKCAKRQIDMNNPYEVEVMEFHWTKLLAALTKDWKEDKQLSRLAVNFAVKTEFTKDPVKPFHHRAEGKLLILDNLLLTWQILALILNLICFSIWPCFMAKIKASLSSFGTTVVASGNTSTRRRRKIPQPNSQLYVRKMPMIPFTRRSIPRALVGRSSGMGGR